MIHHLVIIFAIILMFVSTLLSVKQHKELFSEEKREPNKIIRPLCLDGQDCEWARQQLRALINSDDSYYVVIGGGDSPFTSVREQVIDQAIDTMRTLLSDRWIVFFDQPDFKGTVYLLPKMEMIWDTEDKNENPRINAFIQKFAFYFGRNFSAIVPEGFTIRMTPIPSTVYPGEDVVITSGAHSTMSYSKGTLRRFKINQV